MGQANPPLLSFLQIFLYQVCKGLQMFYFISGLSASLVSLIEQT